MNGLLKWLVSKETIASIIVIIAFALLLLFFSKISSRKLREKSTKGEKATVNRVLNDILKTVIIFAGVLTVLQINGVNITSMIAGLGLASAIVGLALQDYLKDIIMGIRIMSDHYFSIGDCVEYMGREGVILSFNMRVTKIGDISDHSVMSVSNRNISEIRRLSKRLDIELPVSYEQDTAVLNSVLSDICGKISAFEKVESCEHLGIDAFDKSSVSHKIRIICPPAERAKLKIEALTLIFDELNKANIKIPFEQLDVHLDK